MLSGKACNDILYQNQHLYFCLYSRVLLTKHIEEKPVSNVTLLNNGVDYFPSYESEAYVQKIRPHFWTYYNYETVDNNQEAEHCE